MPTIGQNEAWRQARRAEAVRAAIDAHVEATAQARDYNSAATLAGYRDSTVPEWAAEAQAFIAWRDTIWQQVFEAFAEVEAGQRATPTPEEAIAELPSITWP